MQTRQLNLIVATIALFFAAMSGATHAVAQDSYDFDKDIFSVLKQRCFSCHAGENREGDLLLDSKNGMIIGGHTGSPLLASAEESELLARIASTEDGYRMPKEGPPLTAQQQQAFRNWITAGAPWPQATSGDNSKSNSQSASPPKSFAERAGDWWLILSEAYGKPSWKYASWIAVPALITAFFILLHQILYRRRQRKKGEPVARSIMASWLSSFAWIGLIGLTAFAAFLWGRVEESQSKITELEKNGPPKTQLKKTFGISFDAPPKVTRPMHPKRLGGPYYRGNDERNEQLFNGGFYRTANMKVQLLDGDGKPVDYETAVDPTSLAIKFQFQRATGATTKLFAERILQSGFISSSWGGTEKATDRVMFQKEGDQDNWSVTFPLGLTDNGPASGDLFIYYGTLERNRIHYQIHYDLRPGENGTLGDDSEVWMGSAYNLSGRVITGHDDQILLDHWFDFRPIPEIEGKNTESPELLGLPEHLQ